MSMYSIRAFDNRYKSSGRTTAIAGRDEHRSPSRRSLPQWEALVHSNEPVSLPKSYNAETCRPLHRVKTPCRLPPPRARKQKCYHTSAANARTCLSGTWSCTARLRP